FRILASDEERHRLAAQRDPLVLVGHANDGRGAHAILRWLGAFPASTDAGCSRLTGKSRSRSEMIAKNLQTVSSLRMATTLAFGPFRLDADAGILFHGAEPIPLGQRAVALLALLVERAGAPVSKEALIEAAWPAQAIEDSNLTVQIAALRRILADISGETRWIETLPRRGYRYVGPSVTTSRPDHASAASAAPSLTLPDRPSIAVLPFAN